VFRDFKQEKPRVILVASLFSLLIIFTVVTLLRLASVSYQVTIDRITYLIPSFRSTVTGSMPIDMIVLGIISLSLIFFIVNSRSARIAVISGAGAYLSAYFFLPTGYEVAFAILTVGLALSSIGITFYNKKKNNIFYLTLVILTGITLFFAGAYLINWIYYAASGHTLFFREDPLNQHLGTVIFQVAGWISPYIALLISSALAVRTLLDFIATRVTAVVGFRAKLSMLSNLNLQSIYDSRIHNGNNRLYLVIAAISISAGLVTQYPYLATVNPSGVNVSVDAPLYQEMLESLNDNDDLPSVVYKAFVVVNEGDRPLPLLAMYGLSNLLNVSFLDAIRIFPAFLGAGLVWACFYFVSAGSKRTSLLVLAGILTLTSFHLVVGIYAGFFANWMALVANYFAYGALIRLLRSFSYRTLGILAVATFISLFSHPYTWAFFVVIALIVTVIFAIKRRKVKLSNVPLFIIAAVLVSSIIVDVYRNSSVTSRGGISSTIDIVASGTGGEEYLSRWYNLDYTFRYLVGGFFMNIVILSLTLVWSLRAELSEPFNLVLMLSFTIAIVPLLISDYSIQARTLFNMPFHIAAVVVLTNIIHNFKKYHVGFLLSLTAIVILLAYTFRALSNLILPS
jgi:hypothetical protein